ncbi:MAG TPA: polymer-forming cytoskeletal protein [Candidatus Dormibacteraeota bacterium]|nr:polymer-forming cytoskeletal protein [Candidatus Dormibacteraeota bacterium]
MSSRRPASKVATPVPAPPEEKLENGSNGQRNSVVLGPRDRLVGQLYIEGDLRVSGTVDGALEATGDIEIAGSGKVSGAVTAYNRLVVGSDASLIGGDVRVARLTVQDGATFTGRVSMGKHQATVPAEPEPPSAEPAPAPVAEPVAAAAPTKSPDELGTPRASVGWSKRRKGR